MKMIVLTLDSTMAALPRQLAAPFGTACRAKRNPS
jgi:hypothetical protein